MNTAMKEQFANAGPAANEATHQQTRLLDIEALVAEAGAVVAPVWPLESFIACNPLLGLESYPFEEALQRIYSKSDAGADNPGLHQVNLQMIKWCSSFFDIGQSALPMPCRQRGLYACFLSLAPFDQSLHLGQREAKDWLRNLPAASADCIRICLDRLGVGAAQASSFVSQTLAYLPGWAGLVKWREHWPNQPAASAVYPASLMEFLALRLAISCLLWPEAAQVSANSQADVRVKRMVNQLKTRESAYQQALLAKILPNHQAGLAQQIDRRADAQLVFCIDVRSEPLRRRIEALGNYQTLGFAGFFGLPIRTRDYDSGQFKDCCPALLKPAYQIGETALGMDGKAATAYEEVKGLRLASRALYQPLKYNVATPFGLAETLGPWSGLSMLLKSLVPAFGKGPLSLLKNKLQQQVRFEPQFQAEAQAPDQGIALEDQINLAESALRLMGLTCRFAPIVVFFGHGSTTTNNPYAAALDCGACGGNQGAMNASLLAGILNQSTVRQALEERGIHIPLDTQFYAGLHNTTTDEVKILRQPSQPMPDPLLYTQVAADLLQAGQVNRSARAKTLGPAEGGPDLMRRSLDWSETRPEWGLAGNAALIIGPRQLTRNLDLEGRCFLHSYDWEADSTGSLLETLLTAPVVVAQWINNQYLFSSLDNQRFGSGSKITHNVTGKIGIMQGNGSDLMPGLPIQSLRVDDDQDYHQAQRLLVVIYAPQERVMQLIRQHTVLQNLFYNEWIQLCVLDPVDHDCYQLAPRQGGMKSMANNKDRTPC